MIRVPLAGIVIDVFVSFIQREWWDELSTKPLTATFLIPVPESGPLDVKWSGGKMLRIQ